ncbi:MAG: hypothetical protein J6D27_04455 [Ruminiclostridium sp.]|nr:hypothetical protein [Ruminiclostridium sp.]
MNKKISLLLAAAVMVGTLSGCVVKQGGGTVNMPDNQSKPLFPSVSTTSKKEDSAPVTVRPATTTTTKAPETTTTTTTTPVTTPEPEKAPLITKLPYYYAYNSEYMAVKQGNDHYLYNFVTNKLTKLDKNFGTVIFAKGDTVVAVDGSKYQIYNAAKNEMLIEGSDFVVTYASQYNDSVLVTKFEESFNGNKLYFGVINSKCEWEHELKSDLAICTQEDVKINDLRNADYRLCGDSLLVYSYSKNFVYSFDKNTVEPLTDNISILLPDDRLITLSDNKIQCFDGNTRKTSPVYESKNRTAIHAELQHFYLLDDKEYVTIDKETLKSSKFNLKDYDVYNVHGANKDVIIFTAYNPDKELYTIVMNNKGEMVVDPMKMSLDISSYNVYFSGDNIIIYQHGGASYVIDSKKKEVTKCDSETFSIIGVIDTAECFIASKITDEGRGFYFVDAKDITKFYNPLEVGEN